MPPNGPQNPNFPPNQINVQRSRDDVLKDSAIDFSKKKYSKEGPKFYKLVKDTANKDTVVQSFEEFFELSGNVANILQATGATTHVLSAPEKDAVFKVIQEETFRLGVSLQNAKTSFFQILDARYALTKTEKQTLSNYIDTLKEDDIQDLIANTIGDGLKMRDFFKKLKFKKIPIHADFSKFLEQLNVSDATLTESQRKTLYSIYNVHDKAANLSENEVEDLFLGPQAVFATKTQKKQFLKYFFPVATLKQLQDIGGISERAILKAIELQMGTDIQQFGLTVDQVRGRIDISKIRVATSTLDISDDELYSIIEGPGVEEFTRQINSVKDEVARSDIKRAPNGLRSFLTQLQEKEQQGKGIVSGIDKFKEGNVMEMNFLSGDEKLREFYEIIETDIVVENGKKGVSLALIGDGKRYFQDGKKRTFKKSYDALSNFMGQNVEGQQVKPQSIEIIDIGTFQTVKLPTMQRVEKDPLVAKKDDVEQKLEQTGLETRELEERIEEYKIEILGIRDDIENVTRDLEDTSLSDSERQILEEKKAEYEGKLKKLIRQENEAQTMLNEKQGEYESLQRQVDSYGEVTYENLVKKINDFDSAGKNLELKTGVYILPGKEGAGIGWKITGLDKEAGKIELTGFGGVRETLTFEQFLYGFEKMKAKREQINSFADLKAKMMQYNGGIEKLKNSFADITEDQGQLYLDIGGKKSDKPLKYFITKDGDIIKIDSVDANMVTFYTGEIQEKVKSGSNRGGRFNPVDRTYAIGRDSQTLPLSYFYKIITEYGYIPDKENLINKTEDFKDPSRAATSLWKRFRQGYSISSMMHGIKMIGESIQHSWEHGDEVIAAHFALKMGKFLPEEWRRDLQQTVEGHEKEETEKYVKQLKGVDSSIATKRIYSWITNRDTPTYQIEAALTFMYTGYGNLYMKAGLESHRGEWLWYRALGGTPGDTFYREKEKECYERNITFTEEKLVYWWVKEICKKQEQGVHMHGVRHLRSRLHKELKGMWPEGISKEGNDGKKDAGDIRTTKAQLEFMYSELDGGSHANVFGDGTGNGAFERLIARGGELYHYEMIPFVFMFSGEIYGVDEKIIRHIKNISAKGMVTVAPFFMSKYHDMPKYFNAVLDICKDIQDAYPNEHPGIFDDAIDMFSSVLQYHGDPRAYGTDRKPWGASYAQPRKDRLSKAWKFFEKHGEIITDALYTTNGNARNHKIRKIMELKRDENPNYAIFLDTLKAGLGAATKFDADKTLITDAYANSGYTGVKFRKVGSDALGINTAGVFRGDSDVTSLLWGEFVKDVDFLRDLPVGEFGKTPEEDRKNRIKIMKAHVKDAFVIFLSEQGSDDYKLHKLMTSKTAPGEDFQRWGITFDDISQFTESSVDYPENDEKIEQIAIKALGYRKREGGSIQSELSGEGRLGSFTEEVKDRADGALKVPQRPVRPTLDDLDD